MPAASRVDSRPSHLLTVTQVAARWGCSREKVRTLIRAGLLARIPHLGSRWLIHVDEIDRFERAGIQGGTP